MDRTLHNSVLTPHSTTLRVRPFVEIGIASAWETYTSRLNLEKKRKKVILEMRKFIKKKILTAGNCTPFCHPEHLWSHWEVDKQEQAVSNAEVGMGLRDPGGAFPCLCTV